MRIQLKSVGRDLFILVTGIMLSLILNECREGLRTDSEEERITRQLMADIKADTAALAEVSSQLQEILDLDDIRSVDSVSLMERYLNAQYLASYSTFTPNRTALHELMYAGRGATIRHGDLIARAISLHESAYANLREVERAYSDYLISDYIPFLTDHGPYLSDTTPDEQEERLIENFLNDPAFNNRADWCVLMLYNNVMMVETAREEATALLVDLQAVY